MTARQGIILGGVLAALALPSSAWADDAPTTADAKATLESAQDAIATSGDEEPTRELTLAFAGLAQALPALDGDDRREAKRILARPDDGANDPQDDGYTAPEAAQSPFCDANFCVHWVATGRDKPPLDDHDGNEDDDGVPDFVEQVMASAQHSFTVENTNLNWVEPLGDDNEGGGTGTDKTDVYLLELNPNILCCLFGYAAPDPGQGGGESLYSYLVLDNNYDEFGPIDPIDALQVTMAHEYNHVLQFTYDSFEDDWMFESTATWMENNVYPAVDDYINFVPEFARTSKIPLTNAGRKIYGAAVWNHYIQGTSGAGDVRDAWDASPTVDPAHLSVAAYDSVLPGGTGLSPFPGMGTTFAEFAVSTAEWRSAPPSLYEDGAELPDMKRVGKLRVGDPYKKVKLDHLAYALLNVPASAARANDLRLHVKLPDETRSGYAIVGRIGGPTSGTVNQSSELSASGTADLLLTSADYSRVTAVLVNADPRINGAGAYARNDRRYKVKVTSE